jgi:ribosomal protein S18 acetylase RimI-like enzyme
VTADVVALERLAARTWRGLEQRPYGDWLLRAGGGFTGRANSVLAVGDPGCDVAAALERVRQWYAERGLPALLQLPEADPANAAMAAAGWEQQHVTIVQTAPIAPTLDLLAPRPDLETTVDAVPSATWLSLMHDLDQADPAAHVAILTGPAVVGFATVFQDGVPVAIGRCSIEGPWAGVTSVDVAPSRRRQGLGRAVMRSLIAWAADQGTRAVYLQVRALNEPALALYAALGFRTHHPYCYRRPTGPMSPA